MNDIFISIDLEFNASIKKKNLRNWVVNLLPTYQNHKLFKILKNLHLVDLFLIKLAFLLAI